VSFSFSLLVILSSDVRGKSVLPKHESSAGIGWISNVWKCIAGGLDTNANLMVD
jgi:hypothetical protein